MIEKSFSSFLWSRLQTHLTALPLSRSQRVVEMNWCPAATLCRAMSGYWSEVWARRPRQFLFSLRSAASCGGRGGGFLSLVRNLSLFFCCLASCADRFSLRHAPNARRHTNSLASKLNKSQLCVEKKCQWSILLPSLSAPLHPLFRTQKKKKKKSQWHSSV